MSKFLKVGFTNGIESTAGLVLSEDKVSSMSITELSRLFPWSEVPKMRKVQMSPFYDTWEEAFLHQFDDPNFSQGTETLNHTTVREIRSWHAKQQD